MFAYGRARGRLRVAFIFRAIRNRVRRCLGGPRRRGLRLGPRFTTWLRRLALNINAHFGPSFWLTPPYIMFGTSKTLGRMFGNN